MQQSNGYIIGFAIALTVVLGSLLSSAAVLLKERQQTAALLDNKKQILSAVMPIEGLSDQELQKAYNTRIKGTVVNYDGQQVLEGRDGATYTKEESGKFALAVNTKKEYKRDAKERLYPVFKYMSEENPDKVEAYIMPLYGNGLWDNIWGYLAVEQAQSKDWDTIRGVSFDHKGETPGLGARITSKEIQDRYKGKKLFDESGQFAVRMLKGESNGVEDHPHKVDGMSGATITANGVNDMMESYVGHYKAFLKSLEGGVQQASL